MTPEMALLNPSPSRRPPPRSVMYTGVSVIATHTDRVCLVHTCTHRTNLHSPHVLVPHVHVHSGLWFLSRLTKPRTSGVTTRPDTKLTIISTHVSQCMRVVQIPPFQRLVSHYTDNHLYIFSLTLDLPLIIKTIRIKQTSVPTLFLSINNNKF